VGGIRAVNAKGERLLLFVGVIDILQSYRLVKKLEHAWKALLYDGVSSLLTVGVTLSVFAQLPGTF